jgi:hypothetical protein
MFSIQFGSPTLNQSQFGGGAWLESEQHWPRSRSTGKPMMPLLTLRQSLFIVPTINDDTAVTVFVPIELEADGFKSSAVRRFTANDTKQLTALESDSAVHKLGITELMLPDTFSLPKLGMTKQKFNEDDMNQENEDDYVGALRSKLFGRPGWLQDELFFEPRYSFCLQVFEDELRAAESSLDGIFRGGAAYVFLDQRLKRLATNSKCGLCIAQFT